MGSRSSGCPSTVRPRGQDFPRVSAVAIDPLNDRFVAALSDGQVRAYRRDGSELGADAGTDGAEVSALFFHSNGELLAGTSRGEVRTIFPTAGHPGRAVRVFGGRIETFALHPSGSPLFVGGSQGLRALDWPSGTLMDLPMATLTTPLNALAVSPDGRLLVAAKEIGGFLFWRAGWEAWLAAACDRLQHHELFTTLAKPGVAVDTAATLIEIEPYRAYDACRRRAASSPR
jgi:WD40 repeat protein